MASSKTILVTGANRGIGFAILKQLSKHHPQNTYILASRSLSAASAAVTDLQASNSNTKLDALQLDIASDASIGAAVEEVKTKFGKLDVLVNNAGIADLTKPGEDGFREACNRVLDTNVTSFVQVTAAFLPLLVSSPLPQVINISSARASVHKQTTSQLPPTASIAYTVSKTAMNVMMLEMAKLYPEVLFQAVSPGHCRTAFNGYRGKKEPEDGAEVVVRLIGDGEGEKREFGAGFWEYEEGSMGAVPW